MKEPKTPPPAGMNWVIGAIGGRTPCVCRPGSSIVLCSVPQTRAIRDAMEACVKAFDEDSEQPKEHP